MPTATTTTNILKPKFEVMDITPEMAVAMLESSTRRNRNLSAKHVRNYAEDMLSGNWTLNSPITFDTEHNILNGHHRLQAVIVANVTVKMMVVTGLDAASWKNEDRVFVRGGASVLSIQGVENATRSAATVKCIFDYAVNGRISGKDLQLSNPEILRIYGLLNSEYLAHVVTICRRPRQYPNPAILGAIGYIAGPGLADEFAEFVDGLSCLTNLPVNSPILALNRKLTERVHSTINRISLAAYTVLSFNAFMRNRKLQFLRWSESASFPGILSTDDLPDFSEVRDSRTENLHSTWVPTRDLK